MRDLVSLASSLVAACALVAACGANKPRDPKGDARKVNADAGAIPFWDAFVFRGGAFTETVSRRTDVPLPFSDACGASTSPWIGERTASYVVTRDRVTVDVRATTPPGEPIAIRATREKGEFHLEGDVAALAALGMSRDDALRIDETAWRTIDPVTPLVAALAFGATTARGTPRSGDGAVRADLRGRRTDRDGTYEVFDVEARVADQEEAGPDGCETTTVAVKGEVAIVPGTRIARSAHLVGFVETRGCDAACGKTAIRIDARAEPSDGTP